MDDKRKVLYLSLGVSFSSIGLICLIFAALVRYAVLVTPIPINGYFALGTFAFLITGVVLLYCPRYKKLEFQKKMGLWGVIFLAPWLLGFVLFFLVPTIRAFVFSFQDVKIISTGGLSVNNIGWQNFNYILTQSATYTKELVETVLEVVLYTVLVIVFSLLCAVLLNGKFFGRSVARAIFFIPIVMATGLLVQRVTGISSMMMAQSQEESVYGAAIISRLLFSFGVGKTAVEYLISAVNNIFEVVSLSGIQILIFLAALQGIPQQLYEVAKIEGATSYETFWKVTVVMVSPMVLTCTLYTISDLFLRSDLAETFHEVAFTGGGMIGRSAAMSVFFLCVVLIVILLFILPLKKVVFYYD